MNAGKARNSRLALYTAGSAIALTAAVCMLVLPHAVTTGATLYIEQEYLIVGELDLISILAFSLVFHTITLERSGFKENPTNFLTSVAC